MYMAAATAFLIVVQHAPELFSALERCALACVCTESAAYVRPTWAKLKELPALSDVTGGHCEHCRGSRAKPKNAAGWGRCNECLRDVRLISATAARYEYFLKQATLDKLPYIERRHAVYRQTRIRLYLRREVLEAALVVLGGPRALLDKMKKRAAPFKCRVERAAKVEALNMGLDPASKEWELCVAPYMSNGYGGLREIRARRARYAEWEASFKDHVYAERYRAKFVGSHWGESDVRAVFYRRELLQAAFARAGLAFSDDDRLCSQFIHRGRWTVEEVVASTKEIVWMTEHVGYAQIMERESRGIYDQMFMDHGWVEHEVARSRLYEEYYDALSEEIRQDLRENPDVMELMAETGYLVV